MQTYKHSENYIYGAVVIFCKLPEIINWRNSFCHVHRFGQSEIRTHTVSAHKACFVQRLADGGKLFLILSRIGEIGHVLRYVSCCWVTIDQIGMFWVRKRCCLVKKNVWVESSAYLQNLSDSHTHCTVANSKHTVLLSKGLLW